MNSTENHENNEHTALTTATMSDRDFARWGVDLAAYVKSVGVLDENGKFTGQTAWAIHAADGRHIGIAPSRDQAFAAVVREDLEPVSVH